MPAGELRRALRGHGHALSPLVQIGKLGLTDAVIKQVTQALDDHELIKVKVGGECPVDRHEAADRLDREPGVDLVQMVGRVILLYKRHPRTPRYEGKRAQAAKASKVTGDATEKKTAPAAAKKVRARRAGAAAAKRSRRR